jgi:hypothetical protein
MQKHPPTAEVLPQAGIMLLSQTTEFGAQSVHVRSFHFSKAITAGSGRTMTTLKLGISTVLCHQRIAFAVDTPSQSIWLTTSSEVLLWTQQRLLKMSFASATSNQGSGRSSSSSRSRSRWHCLS